MFHPVIKKGIMKIIVQIVTLLFSLLFIAGCTAQNKAPEYAKALLVDVRTPAEFAEGTVAGAINIPVDEIESSLDAIPRDREVVVFCRSGNRSSRAKSILNEHGYDKITNGGSWQQVDAAMRSQKSKQ
jgi:rhodanese-related sulfurtransferase